MATNNTIRFAQHTDQSSNSSQTIQPLGNSVPPMILPSDYNDQRFELTAPSHLPYEPIMQIDGSYSNISQEPLQSGETQSGIGGYTSVMEKYQHSIPEKQCPFINGINCMIDFGDILTPLITNHHTTRNGFNPFSSPSSTDNPYMYMALNSQQYNLMQRQLTLPRCAVPVYIAPQRLKKLVTYIIKLPHPLKRDHGKFITPTNTILRQAQSLYDKSTTQYRWSIIEYLLRMSDKSQQPNKQYVWNTLTLHNRIFVSNLYNQLGVRGKESNALQISKCINTLYDNAVFDRSRFEPRPFDIITLTKEQVMKSDIVCVYCFEHVIWPQNWEVRLSCSHTTFHYACMTNPSSKSKYIFRLDETSVPGRPQVMQGTCPQCQTLEHIKEWNYEFQQLSAYIDTNPVGAPRLLNMLCRLSLMNQVITEVIYAKYLQPYVQGDSRRQSSNGIGNFSDAVTQSNHSIASESNIISTNQSMGNGGSAIQPVRSGTQQTLSNLHKSTPTDDNDINGQNTQDGNHRAIVDINA